MITVKTKEEIELLREGGGRLAKVLRAVAREAKPGISTAKLNEFAEKLIRDGGDTPAFLNYTPSGAGRPFPAALCVSVNDEIVHGIPNENPKVLKEGDIVGLDLGLVHKGLITDTAITVGVGAIDEKAKRLIETTKKALDVGIAASKAGNTTGDIGHAIETFVKPFGYGIVDELGGHAVGYKVHEEPIILNVGKKGTGSELQAGMIIALEPMLNEGSKDIVLDPDGYTFRTADGKRSAHFEHTIVVTEVGPEILTKKK